MKIKTRVKLYDPQVMQTLAKFSFLLMYFLQYIELWSWLRSVFLLLCDLGHETKAMMNNSGPRYKRSKLEKHLNIDILWCVVLLIIMCLTAAIGVYRH